MSEKCQQKSGCDNMAEYKMYWPNNPPTLVCEDHKQKGEGIAKAMGFYLHFEEIEK